jgi:hypothetical protein
MKRIIGLITAGVLVCATLAFAGGDKGKGRTKLERINK